MYPLLRVGAGLVAITALVSRLSSGRSLSELLSERIAVYPGSILDRLRERFGLAPPAAEAPKESPTERLRREIEKSDLTDETKLRLLNILDSKGYAVAKEEFYRALAAPLRL